ncbi:MAG TPA: chitin deacetylase family protein [Blastocatellia bacterium]|nr:chitin deacetylase family protein [Blastocatellia bacterium]
MILFILGISVIAILTFIYFQPLFAVRWLAKQNLKVLYFVETKAKVVALTIDDSPHATVTPRLLDVLKQHSAHATFFLIGNNIIGNEHLVDRMRREGHELGNHLSEDVASVHLSPEEFERQLAEVDKLINPDSPQKWFRPGSGFYNARMLRQAEAQGYRCALGSIYPHDTIVRNPWIISTFIIRKIFPGAIIVIHDGKDDRVRSAKVLRRVLPELQRQGYEVVTLSQLLSVGAQ